MSTDNTVSDSTHNDETERLPWGVDEDRAAITFPDSQPTDTTAYVRHKYKGIYYSTPNHKHWSVLPSDILVRIWPPNPTLAVEQLSLFFQALMGPPALLRSAAFRFLNTLTWPNNPENQQLAAIAYALDHVLASNGNSAGTITIARPDTGYPDARQPVYLRFQQDVADTSVDVPRYPDGDRVDGREHTLDLGLLRSARRIQDAATSPPVEIELALESYGALGGGDLGVGLTIRNETTLDDTYRHQQGGTEHVE
jgi:hypothetical protein